MALEQIAALEPTFREIVHLQGTVERLEQLGTFVANELPESLHQLESVRGQLKVIGNRLSEVNQALLNLTLTPRELDQVNTRLADTIAPLEDVAERLANMPAATPLPRRAARRQQGNGDQRSG